MTPIAAVNGPASLLEKLADPAARALVLAALVGAGMLALRVKSTAARLFAWTAVLYAALAMPLLGWTFPAIPVSLPAPHFTLPAFFATASNQSAAAVSEKNAPPIESIRATTVRTPVSRSFIPRNLATGHRSAVGRASTLEVTPTTVSGSSVTAQPSDPRSIPWLAIAFAAYWMVAALLFARFFVGFALGRRLLRSADEIRDPRAVERLSRFAFAAGVRELPRLAESVAILVPVTLGVRQPSILLPADWREWDDTKLGAVMAHELSHVARRDALTQRLSRIHRAIFWFSPLAWWLDRRLADLAEQASDEAALSGGVDRAAYAKALLGFFEALQSAQGRVWWQGVAMAKAGQAEERVDRILAWKGAVSMSLKKSIVVLIVALSIPVLYLTAGVRPNMQDSPQQQDTATPPPQPAAPQAKAAPVPAPASTATPAPDAVPPARADRAAATPIAPVGPSGPYSSFPPIAPIVAITPRASAAPFALIAPAQLAVPGMAPYGGVYGGVPEGVHGGVVAPAPLAAPGPIYAPWAGESYSQSGSSASTSSSGKGYGYAYGYDDDGQRYVIVSGSSDSVTMSGDSEDAAHARALRKKIPGDFIWFERDEKSYIIRDQATIDRARALFKPQEELGKQQEELGKKQEALGDQQEALGQKMEEVRVKVPDMSAELDKLKAELKKLENGGTQEELGDLQSEIGELQSRIGELQSQAGTQQSEVGRQMSELGRQQGELGRQQGILGRKQGELGREAAIQMRHILDDAVTKGTAQPEQP